MMEQLLDGEAVGVLLGYKDSTTFSDVCEWLVLGIKEA